MPDVAPSGAINVASLMILPLAGRPCHVLPYHAQHAVRIGAVAFCGGRMLIGKSIRLWTDRRRGSS